jgi:hypothetical protein
MNPQQCIPNPTHSLHFMSLRLQKHRDREYHTSDDGEKTDAHASSTTGERHGAAGRLDIRGTGRCRRPWEDRLGHEAAGGARRSRRRSVATGRARSRGDGGLAGRARWRIGSCVGVGRSWLDRHRLALLRVRRQCRGGHGVVGSRRRAVGPAGGVGERDWRARLAGVDDWVDGSREGAADARRADGLDGWIG